jgi:heme-degrading monooxygenase HmoA
MFTRIVELTTQPGKNEQLSATIHDKVLPILKKQKGFVDEMVLVPDNGDNRVLALSIWNSKEDADQYRRAEYPKVQETVRPLLEAEPVVRTYEVHTSTTHKIAAGKAA